MFSPHARDDSLCRIFFVCLMAKIGTNFYVSPSGEKLPKDISFAQVSLGCGIRCGQQASRAHDRHGVCWEKVGPAIADSIVKQRCGRMSDVGGKAEAIYSWRVFRSLTQLRHWLCTAAMVLIAVFSLYQCTHLNRYDASTELGNGHEAA